MLNEMVAMDRTIEFGGREIGFDDSVLTPRPWTEAQSHWARELSARTGPGDVLEVCAGAGHIGLLAVHGTDRHLVQVDASVDACRWAWRNAKAWGIESDVRLGPMAEVLLPEERFAVIIADPPWVPTDRVVQFPEDPETAIDGGPDGLDLARECLDVIARHLARDGAAVLQVGNREQAARLTAHATGLGLTLAEIREFERGALVLLRRTEGEQS